MNLTLTRNNRMVGLHNTKRKVTFAVKEFKDLDKVTTLLCNYACSREFLADALAKYNFTADPSKDIREYSCYSQPNHKVCIFVSKDTFYFRDSKEPFTQFIGCEPEAIGDYLDFIEEHR